MSTVRKYDGADPPDGWRMVRLDEIADAIMGQSPPGETVVELDGKTEELIGLPFIQGNAEFGRAYPIPSKWCANPLKVAEPGDVLFSVRAPVGDVNRAEQTTAIGRGVAAIRFTGADPVFGWHSVNHSRRAFERLAQGSTFEAIGGPEIRALPVLLPPLHEQRAIADVLDSIDVAIERTEAVIAATETLRDALLHELLTRGVPGWHTEWKDVPGIGTIPADWKVVRLGDVATVRNGTTPSRKHGPYWDNGDVPFVKTGRVNDVFIREPNEFITLQAVMNAGAVMVPEGSILIAMIGQGKTRGMTARLGFSAAINQNFAAVYEPSLGFDLDYFFTWASHNYARIRGLGQGSNQDALNCELIQRMQFPMPPILEQQVIAGLLEGVAKSLAEAKKEQGSLQSLKHSTADTLLTGRTRLENRNE